MGEGRLGYLQEAQKEYWEKKTVGNVPLYWLIHPYALKTGMWPNGVGEKQRQMATCDLEGTQGFTPSQRCKTRALSTQ